MDRNKEFEVIDEVPTKEDIMAIISGASVLAGKKAETPSQDSATIEQHTSNGVKKAEGKSSTFKNEEIRLTAKHEEKIADKPAPVKEPLQQTIIRDERGRITKPIPQKTNKNGKAGRKPAIDEDVLDILRQAFLTGATDEEAAEFADISVATLYRYQEKHPEFCEEKEAWKTNPVMKARVTVYNNLNDPRIAAWFLERKKKDEFSTRTEHTGKGGEDLPPIRIEYVTPTDATRINKDPLRSDAETASRLDAPAKSDD